MTVEHYVLHKWTSFEDALSIDRRLKRYWRNSLASDTFANREIRIVLEMNALCTSDTFQITWRIKNCFEMKKELQRSAATVPRSRGVSPNITSVFWFPFKLLMSSWIQGWQHEATTLNREEESFHFNCEKLRNLDVSAILSVAVFKFFKQLVVPDTENGIQRTIRPQNENNRCWNKHCSTLWFIFEPTCPEMQGRFLLHFLPANVIQIDDIQMSKKSRRSPISFDIQIISFTVSDDDFHVSHTDVDPVSHFLS